MKLNALSLSMQESNERANFLPTIEELRELDEENLGFCINCGDTSTCVEPDAHAYLCPVCNKRALYGAAELALMGLCK
jgi:Zn finger protein HypA/HybF involved in hydrogenase expression